MTFSVRKLGTVKKHVALISASSRVGMLQRKVFNVLLKNSFEKGESEKYEIPIGWLANRSSFVSNDYKYLKGSLINLMNTVIELNIFNEDFKNGIEWGATTLLSCASLKKNGVLEYTFSPFINEMIFKPEKYAEINLDEEFKLKSKHSFILYELCQRFIRLKRTPKWDLASVRKLMGVKDDEYKLFSDFKRRILKDSQNEINEKTNLNISLEVNKIGSRIDKIFFNIDEKRARLFNLSVLSLMINVHKIDMEKSEKIIARYGEEKVKKAISYVESTDAYNKKQIKSFEAYLISILKKDVSIAEDKKVPTEPQKSQIPKSQVDYNNVDKAYENLNFISQESFSLYLKKVNLFEKFEKCKFEDAEIKEAFFKYWGDGIKSMSV